MDVNMIFEAMSGFEYVKTSYENVHWNIVTLSKWQGTAFLTSSNNFENHQNSEKQNLTIKETTKHS